MAATFTSKNKCCFVLCDCEIDTVNLLGTDRREGDLYKESHFEQQDY